MKPWVRMYLSQSVLALQEWSWWDWYGVWTGGVGVGDFGCGAGEGVLRGVVGMVGQGEVGGVWGVRCIECVMGRDKSLGLIVISSDGGAAFRNGSILTIRLRRCGPAGGYCRSPVKKELLDLRCQGLAGPWFARRERGTVGTRVSGSMVRGFR